MANPKRATEAAPAADRASADPRRLLAPVLVLVLASGAGQRPAQCLQAQTNSSVSSSGPVEQAASYLFERPDVAHDGQQAQRVDSLSSSMLKTYIRTNSMRAYHLDLHSYRPDAKFAGDPSFVDSQRPQHKARCASHLRQYKDTLRSFKEMDPILSPNSLEAMRLADVFGRPPSGVLSGAQFWLGSYDNCLRLRLPLEPTDQQASTFNSQYCLGVSQFPNWNPQDAKSSIKVGLCLPETCTSSMLNEDAQLLDEVETMMKYQFGSDQPYYRLKLREVYCLPHKTSQIRQPSLSAKFFYLFVGSMVAVCLIATAIDYLDGNLPRNHLTRARERTWRTIVLESFSISRNFTKFFHVRPEEPEMGVASGEDGEPAYDRATFLNSITGLKCIGLLWIICAHTFLVTPIPEANMIDLDHLTRTYLADIYLTAHLMVDTFFALSGVLASYFLFKGGIQNIKTRHWVVLTVHRYMRLTPIYLICYWFTKSVGFLTNEGPLWDFMTAEQSPRLNCNRESWSEALLQLSDFKSPKEHCVPFAWFIANGIKFWMVTPIFVTLIHKSVRRGYMLTMATIMANIALVATLAMRSGVDMKSVIEFKPESADNMLNNMGEVYTRPYSRVGAYLVGLLAGHLMYLIDTKQLEVKLSKNAKIIIWSLFSLTVITLTFMLKIANGIELDDSAIPIVFGLSSALIRPLWAVCTCWLVFALAHGQARWMSKFLSATCWQVMVKLSFCAYLAQGEVIAQLYLSKSQSESFNYSDMIARPIVAIILTLIVSLAMVILLEYPLIGIEELILPKKQKPTESETIKLTQQELNDKDVVEPDANSRGDKVKCT